jgi:hypothetical protein
MKIKKIVWWIMAGLLLALVVVVGGVAHLLFASRTPIGLQPLAPTATAAPKSTPKADPATIGNNPEKYHWPADFELPLEMKIEVPEVPEKIQGPTPMPGAAKKGV